MSALTSVCHHLPYHLPYFSVVFLYSHPTVLTVLLLMFCIQPCNSASLLSGKFRLSVLLCLYDWYGALFFLNSSGISFLCGLVYLGFFCTDDGEGGADSGGCGTSVCVSNEEELNVDDGLSQFTSDDAEPFNVSHDVLVFLHIQKTVRPTTLRQRSCCVEQFTG